MTKRNKPTGAACPLIVIRMDASTDTVIVDGIAYDRSRMNRDEKRIMRRIIVDGLFPNSGEAATARTAVPLVGVR